MFWPGPHRNGPNIKKLFEPFDLAIELAGHCCLKSNASHPAEPIVPKSYSWEWQQCLMMAGEGRGLAGFKYICHLPPLSCPAVCKKSVGTDWNKNECSRKVQERELETLLEWSDHFGLVLSHLNPMFFKVFCGSIMHSVFVFVFVITVW